MGNAYNARQSTFTDGDVITAALFNNEFDQLVLAFNTSGHAHDGTAGEGGNITALRGHALTFGLGTAGTDVVVTFDGETNDGVLSWMEDEDYFQFSDDVLLATTEKLQFRDTAIYINSSTDGQLDIVADTEVQIAATTVDINGNVDISGTLTVGAGLDFAEQAIANVGNIALDSISGDADSDTSITFSGSDVITIAAGGSTRAVINTSGLDVTGTVTADGLTVDAGSSSTETTIQSSTGAAKLHINTTASGGTKYASIELGGINGAFIDLKEPNSDDYDFRVEHGIGSDNVSAVSSKHPLILQTLATSAGGTGGDVKIKREGAEKLATSATGIDITGTITADGLTMLDSEKITLGTGGDLEIYHNGSDSIITEAGSGTGDLLIRGNNLKLQKGDGAEDYLVATMNGSVAIKHDSATKLETSSGGITVTGTVTAEKIDLESSGNEITLGASDAASIKHDGHLKFTVDYNTIFKGTDGNTSLFKVQPDGSTDVLLVRDSGINVTGEIQGDSLDIDGAVDIDTGSAAFDVNTANGNFTVDTGTGDITFKSTDTSHSFVLLTENSANGNDTASPDFVLRKTEVQKDSGGSTVTAAYDVGDIRFESRADNGDNVGYARIKGVVAEQAATASASDGDAKLDFMVMDTTGTSAVTKLVVDKNGIDVTGTVTADGLVMGDDERIKLGAGTDFQIYHESSSNKSIIKESNGAANLQIQGENINIARTDASKSFIQTFDNKDVALYSDGNIKLKTSDGTGSVAAGINVTGTVTADGIQLDGNMETNGDITIQQGHKISFDDTSGGEAFSITTDSNNITKLTESGAGNFNIQADRNRLLNADATVEYFRGGDNSGSKIFGENKLRIATGSGTLNGADLANNIHFYTGDGDAADHRTMLISATGIDVTGTVTADGITNVGALSNTGDVTIKGTSTADANTPILTLERTVDDADGDTFHDLGTIVAKGVDLANTSNRHTYAEIAFNAAIETAGNETGRIIFKTCNSGNNFGSEVASVRGDGFYAQDFIVIQTDGGTNRFTKLKSVHTDDSTSYTVNLPSASGTLALKHAIVGDAMSTSTSTIAHDTVKTYVGKTFVHNGGGDVTLELPAVGSDVSIGDQIDLVNASTTAGAEIILDIAHSSNTTQTVRICTGSDVTEESSNDPHIQKGGVVTLLAIAANTYALFGSGIEDN